ncbi:S8 family peptidase [Nesterenkonia cremea]|uniref:Peptidase S8/S53 domain-containing protein n=1 Tax=Nesterenkonia cremea TaxID=1882340 RepID=A0A917ARR3_9MICC|nr:S8 family serine peptidase [Nesterenkonia cremea]GGE65239.1 hypothetical protein GCM10011401_10560 [Nesterenkonia cremea]
MNGKIKQTGGLVAAAALLTPLASAPSVVNAPDASADAWRDAQYYLEDYGIEDAWDTTRGEDVTIAVLDTGVDADHPTLEGVVVDGTDVSGAGDDGSPVEDQMAPWHGTSVAALAAGRGHEPTDDELEEAPEQGEDLGEGDYEDLTEEEWDEVFEELEEELEMIYGDEWEEIIEDMYGENWREEIRDDLENMGTSGITAEGVAPASSDLLTSTSLIPADDEDDDGDDDSGGLIGVAPEADILSASLLLADSNPHGSDAEEQIAEAVVWAVDNGADIINMSVGSGAVEWPESWDDAFMHAAENDVLVVASAGNRGSGHMSAGAPATIPGVLTVAGVDEDRNISEDASTQGIAIDLAAAGERIPGADLEDSYHLWDGTSAAAPIVAGAAALVMAAHPDLSAPEVMHRLVSTADPENGDDEIDPEYGHGVLNVDQAVNSDDVPQFDEDEYDTLEEWIRVHRRDDDEAGGHEDIPEASSVEASPEGDPRERPQASEASTVQDWAGPAVLGAAGLLTIAIIAVAAVHLSSRRKG